MVDMRQRRPDEYPSIRMQGDGYFIKTKEGWSGPWGSAAEARRAYDQHFRQDEE